MKKARNPCKIKAFRTFLWQGQKGSVSPAGSVGASASQRSPPETRTPRHVTRAVRSSHLHKRKRKKSRKNDSFPFWQGQKDSTVCFGFALHTYRSTTQILTNFGTRRPLLSKNDTLYHFLNAKTLTGSNPNIISKQKNNSLQMQ